MNIQLESYIKSLESQVRYLYNNYSPLSAFERGQIYALEEVIEHLKNIYNSQVT